MRSYCVKLFLLFINSLAAVAAVITVPSNGDLQAAINIANSGDTIALTAGVTYSGSFYLPAKAGQAYITVTSTGFPATGTVRVSPTDASRMAKVTNPKGGAVFYSSGVAHHYQFIGVEIAAPPGIYSMDLFSIGTGIETAASQTAHDFILDRVYIHGDPQSGCKRGVGLNGAAITIKNSYIASIKSTTQDSQAMAGWNGPGPFTITNNYIEASGENIMFGGADVSINGLVPSDITITGNYFNKPLTWRIGSGSYAGTPWIVKNLIEFKNAQRVNVSGNVFDNNWVMSQDGTAIVFTVRTENGSVPWAVVQDVVFANNTIRHVGSGITILGHDDATNLGAVRRLTISNNLLQDVGNGGGGRALLILNGFDTVKVDHNTFLQTGNTITFASAPGTPFIYTNNIAPSNSYGVFGDAVGIGVIALNTYAGAYTFLKNVVIGANASVYPAGNFFPATMDQVGFTSVSAGNYALLDSSTYHNAGTDGKNPGADISILTPLANAALSGGTVPTIPPPTPVPVTLALSPKTVTLTASGQAAFTATVTGTSNTAVIWTLTPNVGSMNGNTYNAPSTITSVQTVTLKAVNQTNPTAFDTAVITLKPPAVVPPPPTVSSIAVFGTGLTSTGVAAADGAADPHYALVVNPDRTISGTTAYVVLSNAYPFPVWVPNRPTAKWIAPTASQVTGNANGNYTYRTTFSLQGFKPTTAALKGIVSADNAVTIVLNGNTIATGISTYSVLTPFTINSGFVAGTNTLDFIVYNGGGPTGLRVELSGTASQ